MLYVSVAMLSTPARTYPRWDCVHAVIGVNMSEFVMITSHSFVLASHVVAPSHHVCFAVGLRQNIRVPLPRFIFFLLFRISPPLVGHIVTCFVPGVSTMFPNACLYHKLLSRNSNAIHHWLCLSPRCVVSLVRSWPSNVSAQMSYLPSRYGGVADRGCLAGECWAQYPSVLGSVWL